MNDNEILEEVYNYLFHKANHTDEGYEWREVCGLMKLIDDRDEELAKIRHRRLMKEMLALTPPLGVEKYDDGELFCK